MVEVGITIIDKGLAYLMLAHLLLFEADI